MFCVLGVKVSKVQEAGRHAGGSLQHRKRLKAAGYSAATGGPNQGGKIIMGNNPRYGRGLD